MTKPIRKTRWYPGTTKPLRPGRYQRRHHKYNVRQWEERWTGERWELLLRGHWRVSLYQELEWRGQVKP